MIDFSGRNGLNSLIWNIFGRNVASFTFCYKDNELIITKRTGLHYAGIVDYLQIVKLFFFFLDWMMKTLIRFINDQCLSVNTTILMLQLEI